MRILSFIFVSFTMFAMFSCKDSIQGDITDNHSPETYTIVDTIIRFGDNRFKTQVEINWWGDDVDGYISGYEISFDKAVWTYTEEQDSVFLLEIPDGSDTFDFTFYVRAIDNEGARDESPASIVYPVKNSPPSVVFTYSSSSPKRNPVSSFPILKYTWTGSDPDGDENLSHYEIYLNDTLQSPVIVDAVYSSIILETDRDDYTADTLDCDILQGNSLILHDEKLWGLVLDDSNRLFIRAVDIVGEKSPFEESDLVYVRKPTSTTLLVNAYDKSIDDREQFYIDNLNLNGITSFDILRINELTDDEMSYTELSVDNVTQEKIFNLFDVIIWFGKDVSYSLSLAQRTTSSFLNKGGKLFIAVEIASSIDEQAGYLDFTPIDSLVNMPSGVSGFRIERDSLMPQVSGWPVLVASKIISSARPFYENVNSVSLYDAQILKTGSFGKAAWEGKSTVIAKMMNGGHTNFIISSLELHNLNGNNNIQDLFEKLFVDEFGL